MAPRTGRLHGIFGHLSGLRGDAEVAEQVGG
jgi:hypothetical protein